GPYTLTAPASGLAGCPVPSTPAGSTLALHGALPISPPSSSARSGAPLAPQPVVQLQDANGNPVNQGGVVVTATPSPAGATASNNARKTTRLDARHRTRSTPAGSVGSYTLSFGGTGITPVSSGAIALSAGAA